MKIVNSFSVFIYLGFILFLFAGVGCSGMQRHVYEQAGMDEGRGPASDPSTVDEYGMYAPKSTRSRGLASKWSEGDNPPAVKRQWEDVRAGNSGFRVRRTSANDFFDSPEKNSLWNSQGQDNYLFSRNVIRSVGDQLVLGVQKDLQTDISYELRRMTPEPEKDTSMRTIAQNQDKKAESSDQVDTKASANNPNAPGAKTEDYGFVDKIPVYVIENFGTDTFRVKGQKEVIYKGQRRRVEVVGLVRKQDIDRDDIVQSAKMLDYRVSVLN